MSTTRYHWCPNLGALLFFVVLPWLFSCSFSSSRQSSFVNPRSYAPLSLESLSKDPEVYLLKEPSLAGHKVFLSLLKECPLKEGTSLFATTRQLFIGIENLTMLEQSQETVEGISVLISKASGMLEKKRLHFLSLSLREGDCVKDALFWSFEDAAEAADPFAGLLAEKERIVTMLD